MVNVAKDARELFRTSTVESSVVSLGRDALSAILTRFVGARLFALRECDSTRPFALCRNAPHHREQRRKLHFYNFFLLFTNYIKTPARKRIKK